MKKFSAFVCVIALFVVTGCVGQQVQQEQTTTETIEQAQTTTETKIAEYCTNTGGTLAENLCVYPDGRKCDAEENYNGKCEKVAAGGASGGARIEGTWTRTGTDPAVVTIKDDGSYVSSGKCLVNGIFTQPEIDTEKEEEMFITLTITSTNCENVPAGLSVTYQYEITEDDKSMTWSTSGLTESFVRL